MNVWWDILLSFAAFAPCLAYYAFAAAAAVYLGHWPSYAHPDPKDLPASFGPGYWIVAIIQTGWMLYQFPILILASVRMWRADRPTRFALAMLPASLVLLTFIVVFFNPHGVVDWFWD